MLCLLSLLCGFSEKSPSAVFNLNTKIDLWFGLKEKGSSTGFSFSSSFSDCSCLLPLFYSFILQHEDFKTSL